MKTKRNLLAILFVLVVVPLSAMAYFYIPRSVVTDPESTTIEQIVVGPIMAYYETEDAPTFTWHPETEEEQETAQQIVEYLATCQERRTMQRDVGYIPGDWRCIVIVMNTLYGQRGIILRPSHVDDAKTDSDWLKSTNISYALFRDNTGSNGNAIAGYFHTFRGKLLNPEEMRGYILETLNLPEDFI